MKSKDQPIKIGELVLEDLRDKDRDRDRGLEFEQSERQKNW